MVNDADATYNNNNKQFKMQNIEENVLNHRCIVSLPHQHTFWPEIYVKHASLPNLTLINIIAQNYTNWVVRLSHIEWR